jgi:hypothetical protein
MGSLVAIYREGGAQKLIDSGRRGLVGVGGVVGEHEGARVRTSWWPQMVRR